MHAHYLRAAVLFRPMVPFIPEIVRNFSELSVFISSGDRDPIVSHDQPERLAAMLESGGADVAIFWNRGGHELNRDDVDTAKAWLFANVKKRIAA